MSQFLWAVSLDGSGSGSLMRLKVTQLGVELISSPLMGFWQAPFLTGCWPETSVPLYMGLLVGCLSVFMIWYLAFLKVSVPRERAQDGGHAVL